MASGFCVVLQNHFYLNGCGYNPGSGCNQPLSCVVQVWQQALAQHTAANTRFGFVSHNHHALPIPELTRHAAEGVLPHEETCDHNRVRNHMGDSDQLSVIYPPHQRCASQAARVNMILSLANSYSACTPLCDAGFAEDTVKRMTGHRRSHDAQLPAQSDGHSIAQHSTA